MKILLSSYACEPHRGSEPGIGWNWAIELARAGHDVCVLTCGSNHRNPIEAERANGAVPERLTFAYYDLSWWRRPGYANQKFIRTHYMCWQLGAYKFAKHLQAGCSFDLVHHLTWGALRQPSFMGSLGIPFVFGPAGGGERAPIRLRVGYPFRGWAVDVIRDISNLFIKIDPLMLSTFKKATLILLKTPFSKHLVPRKYQNKCRVQMEIGISTKFISKPKSYLRKKAATFRVLYVGRLLYWKGLHLSLPAFRYLVTRWPNAHFTIVGTGPEERFFRSLAEKLCVSKNIDWISCVDHRKLPTIYADHDVFLFPSLHDSSGNAVLEALAAGLPVVCLDLGGPSCIVENSCGRVIDTQNSGRRAVINALGQSLVDLAGDSTLLQKISSNAINRAREYEWSSVVRSISKEFTRLEP